MVAGNTWVMCSVYMVNAFGALSATGVGKLVSGNTDKVAPLSE